MWSYSAICLHRRRALRKIGLPTYRGAGGWRASRAGRWGGRGRGVQRQDAEAEFECEDAAHRLIDTRLRDLSSGDGVLERVDHEAHRTGIIRPFQQIVARLDR